MSEQCSREGNETNEVEPGGSMDGSANNNEFEQQQQQRGTGVKFVQQWRHRGSRQFRRRQWIQQGETTRGRQVVNISKTQNAKT